MEDNIFEAASKQGSSGKKKAFNEKSENHAAANARKVTKVENEDEGEIAQMLKKMQDMKIDLENQLANIYRKGRESKIDVSLLVENANALTKQQLEKMEEQQRLLMEKIDIAITKESCLKKKGKNKEKDRKSVV